MRRRRFLVLLASLCAAIGSRATAQTVNPNGPRPGGGRGWGRRGVDDYQLPAELADYQKLSLILGRVSDRAVTVSVLSGETVEGYFEYGTKAEPYGKKTGMINFPAGQAVETVFADLLSDTQHYYRLNYRPLGTREFVRRAPGAFHTQRASGSTFTFAIQGDSHPERPQMSDPNLYARTLLNAAKDHPDFYICMGDDFSVETIREVSAAAVGARYTLQRPFLGLVAQSAPIFLLNGNHEQASLFNFDQRDERHDVAVFAQRARNHYFPTVAPDQFYGGDTASLAGIGLLKDYYSWTWGDALFVVLDNYWQSPTQVDSGLRERGGGGKDDRPHDRDWWGLTLGDAQYQWFRRTLEQSKAKYKFVFAHHVMGSGRGGIDECDLWEWGGHNKRGDWEFAERRPGWESPVHQLMVKHDVTIFFQGHDHLFARQKCDGIIYQEVPMPADQGYFAYNADRYESGIKLPNSGHLRVTVSPENVTVDYVRCYLPKDENAGRQTGEIAHTYTIKAPVLA